MSSTEYKASRQDIEFLLHDVLKVGVLTHAKQLSDFDETLFRDILYEGITFSEEVLAPINKIGDQVGAQLKDGKVITPKGFKEAWKQFSDSGWLGISSPSEFGGQGLPESVGMGVKETMFAANPSFALYSILTTGAANLIYSFGSEEQKNTYCENMYTGKWSGSMCLTEPQAGSYVGDVKTTATPEKDVYKIKGNKIFITGGDQDLTENIVHLVLARIPDAPAGTKGISLFIVPKYRIEKNKLVHNDVTTVGLEHKMGIKGSATATLNFGENNECYGYLLQSPNQGMKQMFQMMNEARLQVALQGVGQADAALGNSLYYAQQRIQGISIDGAKDASLDRIPIIEHPDIADSLLYMKAMTEGIRAITYATAFYLDCVHYGNPERKEYYQDLVDIHVPIAKSFATDEGLEVINKGIQVLGGVGYTNDFPLEQNYRDLRIAPIYEGTNGIQALDLIGRKLTLHNGRLFKHLIKEFETIQLEIAKSTFLKESIQVWKEYVAGLILMHDDLQTKMRQGYSSNAVLHSKHIIRLFGDVLSCFYLIKEGIEVESKLANMDIKIDSIQEQAIHHPEIKFLYQKLLTIEYYALNILPRQEGYLRVLQKGSSVALYTFF